ncbi:MAG: hypothetical protein B7X39_19400 [Lysobacterales bacterium 14-68-21]|jgi:F1F0 ATPase subunit 2|nr:MAG: hypothetical protein B7X45_17135 [Xanthomonadales bacterium 15-68-25]OZB63443.1 MAG: hypothetical protein B7X39_19400 [Xanthomonadales bacterium 14-68-21]
MTLPLTELPFAPAVGIGLLGGGLVGLLHFIGLRYSVRLLAAGRTGLALASQGLRVAISALLLAALLRFGLAALLAGFMGFLVARHALLRERGATSAAQDVPSPTRKPHA